LVLMFANVCFGTFENLKEIVGRRDIYYSKNNIKLFRLCGG